MAHELPVNVIEQIFPDFIKSREDLRTSQFIIANQQAQLGDDLTVPIAEGARPASAGPLEGQEVHDIPSGTGWNLYVEPSGQLRGSVLFNRDEFDESTVAGWAVDLRRILTSAVREPDRDRRLLADPSSRRENRE